MTSLRPVVEPNSAPPGYSSIAVSPVQSFDTRVNVSNDDLVSAVSAQSLPFSSPARPSNGDDARRRSDVHFYENGAEQTNLPRRRYTSLPYDDPALFSENLRSSINTTGASEPTSVPAAPSISRTISTHSVGTRLNPTNYVSLSRKTTSRRRAFSLYRSSASITGNYTVNPYLHVPAALLRQAAGHARGEGTRNRKNLTFEVENGGIDVNIFLVGQPGESDDMPWRTTLDMKIKGSDGTTFPLIAKIHTPDLPRRAFYLNASGIDGYHAIHMPPSLHGLVTITVVAGDLDSHISLSPEFFAKAIILNETATARSYFVGELGEWSRDKQGWEGDRVDVSVVRGMVRLQFLGEKDKDRLRRVMWKFGF